MMELKIMPYEQPAAIKFNFEELKTELEERVKVYEKMVYDETQIQQAKADRADLNKLKKALNDERIRREKDYMVPFNEFKAQINEIIAIIDKPVAIIDKQVKEFEEKEKQEKLMITVNYTDGLITNGGISTDVFKKELGDEATKEFFDNIFFGTAR